MPWCPEEKSSNYEQALYLGPGAGDFAGIEAKDLFRAPPAPAAFVVEGRSAKRVAKISGGVGSWSATRRDIERRGRDNLTLLFTDTLCEDQDAYRFLIAGAAILLGIDLPPGARPAITDFPAWEDREPYKAFVMGLRESTKVLLPGLVWLADGRDPWDIYEHERFLGNSRIDPCSKILKRQISYRWLRGHCDPSVTTIIVGIDYEEIERFDDGRGGGIQPRAKAQGWRVEAPLCDPPYLSWADRQRAIREHGLWLPRLNALGFAHNNCGGFCCKGGQGHWKLMLRVFPERYAYCEWREQQIIAKLGNVSMLTDRRGGDGKKPLTLETLRQRELRPDEAAEMGACGCFFGEDHASDGSPSVRRRPA